jgi:hypothetical protein
LNGDFDFDGNVKYLCVIAVRDLFAAGFANNTVCFVKQLCERIGVCFTGF